MDKLLGIFLPALVALVLRTLKIENHNAKVVTSVAICFIVGCGVWYFTGKSFERTADNMEALAGYIAILVATSQVTYQLKKGFSE